MLCEGLTKFIGPCKVVASHQLLSTYHGIIRGQTAAPAFWLGRIQVARAVERLHGIFNELMHVARAALYCIVVAVLLERSHCCPHVAVGAQKARHGDDTQPPVVPGTNHHAGDSPNQGSRRRQCQEQPPCSNMHLCDAMPVSDRS